MFVNWIVFDTYRLYENSRFAYFFFRNFTTTTFGHVQNFYFFEIQLFFRNFWNKTDKEGWLFFFLIFFDFFWFFFENLWINEKGTSTYIFLLWFFALVFCSGFLLWFFALVLWMELHFFLKKEQHELLKNQELTLSTHQADRFDEPHEAMQSGWNSLSGPSNPSTTRVLHSSCLLLTCTPVSTGDVSWANQFSLCYNSLGSQRERTHIKWIPPTS